MKKTTQKNFRISELSVNLMRQIAEKNSVTETAVVEYCVTRYAIDMDLSVEIAKNLLLANISEILSVNLKINSSPGRQLAQDMMDDGLTKREQKVALKKLLASPKPPANPRS